MLTGGGKSSPALRRDGVSLVRVRGAAVASLDRGRVQGARERGHELTAVTQSQEGQPGVTRRSNAKGRATAHRGRGHQTESNSAETEETHQTWSRFLLKR